MLTTIHIDEYVNGFSVRVYDPKDGFAVNEIHEEKIEALRAVLDWVSNDIKKELALKQTYAGRQAI